jgi:hypothetical protein
VTKRANAERERDDDDQSKAGFISDQLLPIHLISFGICSGDGLHLSPASSLEWRSPLGRCGRSTFFSHFQKRQAEVKPADPVEKNWATAVISQRANLLWLNNQ